MSNSSTKNQNIRSFNAAHRLRPFDRTHGLRPRNNARRFQGGFTLVELLISIAVMVALAGVGMLELSGARNRGLFIETSDRIVATTRAAMAKSRAQEQGEQWGVHFENPSSGDDFYEMWSGDSYTDADGVHLGRVYLDGATFDVPASGAAVDVTFAKATGLPSESKTVTIRSTTMTGISRTFIISKFGSVSYE